MPRIALAALLALAAGSSVALAQPLTTGFTYQGTLQLNGSALSGSADLQFRLFDSASGGTQVGSTLQSLGQAVTDGRVAVVLDFGPTAFAGSRRWVEVAVRSPAGGGAYTTLTPRQELTAAPNALYSTQAGNASTLGGQAASFYSNAANLTGSLPDARLSSNVPKLNATNAFTAGNSFAGTSSFPGQSIFSGPAAFSGPASFTNPASTYAGDGSALVGLWKLGGNAGVNSTTQFIGTVDAVPVSIRSNNARVLSLTTQSGVFDSDLATHVHTANVLAGAAANRIDNGAHGATVAGGGMDRYEQGSPDASKNIAAADFATVGGGGGNYAGTHHSIIAGGQLGRIDGQSQGAFLGGGSLRSITGLGLYSVIVGGYNQTIDSGYSSILGGYANTIHASSATIGGGDDNTVGVGADWATVSGGSWNLAAAPFAVIGGGGPADGADPSGTRNVVFDAFGVIAGGAGNRAGTNDNDVNSALFCTIGGGKFNQASGYASTVGGGDSNAATNPDAIVGGGALNLAGALQSSVLGGYGNAALGVASSVLGGNFNIAQGDYASVLGGVSNQASGTHSAVGGGLSNTANGTLGFIGAGQFNAQSGTGSAVVSGWGNQANGDWGFIGGGRDNTTGPHECTVAGGRANSAVGLNSSICGGYRNETPGNYAVASGGNFNRALADFAVIAGGGPADPSTDSTAASTNNRVFDAYGVIGGGGGNRAGSDDANPYSAIYCTIAGGKANTASGYGSTVGGGDSNLASGNVSVVAGGTFNQATGLQAFIGCGQSNTASGLRSSVLGGENNWAYGGHAVCLGGSNNYAGAETALAWGANSFVTGNYSVALGRSAWATHDRSFVWNDGSTGVAGDTGPGQFVIQAGGGVAINTPPTLWTDLHLKNRNGFNHTKFFMESDTRNEGILFDVYAANTSDTYATLEIDHATVQSNLESRFTRVVLDAAGTLIVPGKLQAGTKQFLIDHPLDPANKTLAHTCVESPDMKTIYDGVVNTDDAGYADIELPDYFEALNTDYRYQLTVLDEGDDRDFVWAKVVRKIHGNRFSIRTSRGGVEVSWQVTGVRNDPFARANRGAVESDKAPRDRGKYLHPDAWGRPPSEGMYFHSASANPAPRP